MSGDYRNLWADLGIDLAKHDAFLAALPQAVESTFLSQENRPQAMEYFTALLADIHGGRVAELVAHKEKGGKVAGTFCVYVPEEILQAAGVVSVGLCAGSQFPVPAGEEVLPANLCPLIKASLGFKLSRICPFFQVADFLVGETTCDGKKKAWEILDTFQPTYVMELPQKKGEADRRFWRQEVERFLRYVEEKTGRQVTAPALAEAVEVFNQKRAVLARLYRARWQRPVPISGRDALLVTQLSFFDDVARFVRQASLLCDELEERAKKGIGIAKPEAPRVLIAGTPLPLPYWSLHAAVEGTGAVVVAEESCTGTRYFEASVDLPPDPTLDDLLDAIASRGMAVNCACFTPNRARIEDILRLARASQADGVIYYNLQFCQTYAVEAYLVEKALQEAGIPVLRIETDFSPPSGQLLTRVEAFVEMLAPAN